jgi:hypothetical protein
MHTFRIKRRTKLDDKSTKLVFIGYDERSKTYKLYNSIEKSDFEHKCLHK